MPNRARAGTLFTIVLAVLMALLAGDALAQQVMLSPSAPARKCLVVDTLWIMFDATLQDVEAAYFSLTYDASHVIPISVIKAPTFDSSVYLNYTIHTGDSISINLGFLVGNFDGPGPVAGLVYSPGTILTSSPVDFMASVLRDPDNNDIPHSTAVGAVVTTTCCCRFQGDLDSSGYLDVLDVVADINYIFRNGDVPFQDVGCPENRGEVNCDQVPNVLDIIRIVNVAFRTYDYDAEICDPCDCNPYPTGCP